MNNKYTQTIAIFICMLIVNLPIAMADSYSISQINPVPVAVGVLIVGFAIIMPAIMSYLIGAGLATGVAMAACSDEIDGGKAYYAKGTTTGILDTGQQGTYDDTCSGNILAEGYCEGDNVKIANLDCTTVGMTCQNGACSSGTTASGQLKILKVSGENLVDGYRKSINDYFYIEAEASFGDGTAIKPQNVKLETKGVYYDFQSCEQVQPLNKYICKYTSTKNMNSYLEDDISFTIYLFSGTTSSSPQVDNKPVKFMIDSLPPTVTISTPPQQNSDGNTTFSYSISDTTPKSSGILKAEYYIGSFKVGEKIFNTSESSVSAQENIKIYTSTESIEEEVTLKVVAYDGVKNSGETESVFMLDSKPPQIVKDSFFIRDKSNNLMKSIPQDGLKGTTISLMLESGNGVNHVFLLVTPLSSTYPANTWKEGACSTAMNNISNCIWTGIDIDKYGNMNTILVNASDYLGNSLSASIGDYLLNVEKDAPTIKQGTSVKLKFADTGQEVKYLSNYSDSIDREKINIYLNLTEDYPGMDNRGVSLDLSSYGGDAKTLATKCTHIIFKQEITEKILDHYYSCEFDDIELSIQADLSNLPFTFTDFFGNKNTYSHNPLIKLDNKKPEIKFLGGSYTDEDGNKWIGPQDNFVVKIKEEGSGINETNVKFNEITATKCTQAGSEFTCTAPVTGITKAQHLSMIDLEASVKDNVGYVEDNETRTKTRIRVDAEVPQIISLKIQSTGALPDIITSGEGLKVVAVITDNVSVDGLLNLSALNTARTGDIRQPENMNPDSECVKGVNNWTCTWTVAEIWRRNGNPGDEVTITLNLTDAVGNYNVTAQKIRVFGKTADTAPNNFDVYPELGMMHPASGISRLILSIMPNPPGYKLTVPFYHKLKILRDEDKIEIIKEVVTDCTIGADVNLNEWFSKPEVYSDELTLYTPTSTFVDSGQNPQLENYNRLELVFKHGGTGGLTPEFMNKYDDFVVNCTVWTYEAVNGVVFSEPEKDVIQIPITLVDSALTGAPDQILIDKIKEAQSGWLAEAEWIQKLDDLVSLLESICNIGTTLTTIWTVLSGLETIGFGLQQITYTQTIGDWIFKISCAGYEGLGALIYPLWYSKLDQVGPSLTRMTECFGMKGADMEQATKAQEMNRTGSEGAGKQAGQGSETISLKRFCYYLTCQHSEKLMAKLNEWTGGNLISNLGGTVPADVQKNELYSSTAGRLLSTSGGFSVQDNIIFAVVGGCLPAITHNLKKYREIECVYIKCLKDSAKDGMNRAQCDTKRGESICLTFFGELMSMIPFVSLIKNLGSSMSDIGKNLVPTMINFLFDGILCKKFAGTDNPAKKVVKLFCDGAHTYYSIVDVMNEVKGMDKYFKADTWKFGAASATVCDEAMCKGIWKDGSCTCTTTADCISGTCQNGACA